MYAADLASKSLKDLQPQICEAMDALLSELNKEDDISIHYARSANTGRRLPTNFNRNRVQNYNNNNNNNYNNNNNNNNNNNSNYVPRNNSRANTASRSNTGADTRQRPRTSAKECLLCKTAKRAYQGHDIANCWFISKFDKMDIVDAFQLNVDNEDVDNSCEGGYQCDTVQQEESNAYVMSVEPPSAQSAPSSVLRVSVAVSPYFYAFYEHHILYW